ncbi:hypothetical protein H7U37_06510 [Pseudoflavonifractor phocaeensis]|uniref:hypothetical protein n=1 Tax=Pseudoflavonifractor phocaeensis TaxID=1870988 RepID=UPI00195D5B58|nr:hypothetical protein [Pseudoflavonifractor phocaeensis]MBM6870331.1 hypothetical protein [Pseudoflavonifractor phocaeensis]MBM6938186.1 hypothetical protein [Pseudoflavonifractor phocaeensis]
MATYTPTISLHQWAPEDPFLRQDFNEDFQKIDTAIQNVRTSPSGIYGTYVGTGSTITVTLGFRPSFMLLISTHSSAQNASDVVAALGVSGMMVSIIRSYSNSIYTSCTFHDTGFTISEGSSGGLNVEGATFHYVALY